MAESERVSGPPLCISRLWHLTSVQYLPVLISKVEKVCEENGLRNDSIVMRMTGCPNGCARPYLAGECPLCLVYGENRNSEYCEQRWHLLGRHRDLI